MKLTTQAVIAMIPLLLCMNESKSQSPVQVDSAAIHGQFLKYQEALIMRDTLSIGNFYTDNAISLLQNQPVRRGRDLIIRRWNRSLSNPILIRMTSTEVSVSPSGQDAFQFGTFQINAADSNNAVLASGKIMFLWKKQPDGWRIALEMDNFNAPEMRKPPVQTKQ